MEEEKRNMLWRMKRIFELLREKEGEDVYKTELRKVAGLDSKSAEVYIGVIEFVQQELKEKNYRFEAKRAGRHTVMRLEKE